MRTLEHASIHHAAPTTMPLFPTQGIPCLPDGAIGAPGPPRSPRPPGLSIALFLATFFVLQWGWSAARGSWIERLVVDRMTVKTAAALIDTLDPSVGVQAVGTRLKAAGGGINILNGCEGVEVVFLLASAMLVAPMGWRLRLLGIVIGSGLVFVLNQARVIGLFYAFRSDRALFDSLHGIFAPLLMVLLAGLFFVAWLDWHGPRRTGDPNP
jgi:exosortase/archaeosortase family protein